MLSNCLIGVMIKVWLRTPPESAIRGVAGKSKKSTKRGQQKVLSLSWNSPLPPPPPRSEPLRAGLLISKNDAVLGQFADGRCNDGILPLGVLWL